MHLREALGGVAGGGLEHSEEATAVTFGISHLTMLTESFRCRRARLMALRKVLLDTNPCHVLVQACLLSAGRNLLSRAPEAAREEIGGLLRAIDVLHELDQWGLAPSFTAS